MNLLVIDTSTAMELIAARKGDRESDLTAHAGRSHSAMLFDLIARALDELDLPVRALELIGVGIGPGSFTGIRIAVSTARMFAQVLEVPLVGVHSTLLYAVSTGAPAGRQVLVAFDAKKGRVFGALYEAGAPGEIPLTLIEPGDYDISHLALHAGADCVCTGDGAARYREELARLLPRHTLIDSPVPSGGAALTLIETLHREDRGAHAGYEHVLPYYARKSDAELILEKKKLAGM